MIAGIFKVAGESKQQRRSFPAGHPNPIPNNVVRTHRDSQHNSILAYIHCKHYKCASLHPLKNPIGYFLLLSIHLCKELEVGVPEIWSVNLRLLYVLLLVKKRGLHGCTAGGWSIGRPLRIAAKREDFQAFPAKPGMQVFFLQNISSIFCKVYSKNSLTIATPVFKTGNGLPTSSSFQEHGRDRKGAKGAGWEI